jgi:hypothetical protein
MMDFHFRISKKQSSRIRFESESRKQQSNEADATQDAEQLVVKSIAVLRRTERSLRHSHGPLLKVVLLSSSSLCDDETGGGNKLCHQQWNKGSY